MPYGTVNADIIQSSVSGVSLGAGNASIMKNRIINGAMVIDQRNAGALVSPAVNAAYYLDRWLATTTIAGKYSIGQDAGAVTPPVGFTDYLGITSLSAYTAGASENYAILQRIEGYNVADLGWGTANAKPVTLSFWVRSSLTGTFGGTVRNHNSTRSYPYSYTISSANTWEQKSVTITGDTTGSWLTTNDTGVSLLFGLGAGATVSGPANAWASTNYVNVTGAVSVVGTNGATWYVTGVQLEVGESATGFEYRQFGQELALCQRYYCKTFNYDVAPAQNIGGSGQIGFLSQAAQLWDAMWRYPVEMRVAPTATTFSPNQASSNWSLNSDAPVASFVTLGTAGLICRASTPAAGGRSYTIHITASSEL